jgi:hypothetical protein
MDKGGSEMREFLKPMRQRMQRFKLDRLMPYIEIFLVATIVPIYIGLLGVTVVWLRDFLVWLPEALRLA